MPRPLHDLRQPQIGPTAGDLGQSAFAANLRDVDGPDAGPQIEATVRPWEAPEPRNPPPGQRRPGGPALRLGADVKD
ncbi:MAG: hypothetical protein A6D92_13295 [Symbiobacterium thermophilum]|uniref:Uncharacterized protein n=1 Tax=Symbiobacterium thermophilum TaxID=2734 RepID=A0A1Y2T4Y1_SYMTR|nr:MAG: hypothetical protein A6D92_13295 [Symbiobacterium thermophilum]